MIYMANPKNNRFYLLFVEQDLFNVWVLKRVFGGMYNNHRRIIVEAFASEKEAWAALTEIEYQKRQRGYIYADNFARTQSISNAIPLKAIKPKLVKESTLEICFFDQPELPF